MSKSQWITDYIGRLQSEHIVLHEVGNPQILAPAHHRVLDTENWGKAANIAAQQGYRHAGIWADQIEAQIIIRALLAFDGDYLALETALSLNQPVIPSHTPYYPGVDHLERHLQDMFGIAFSDHPDSRQWTRHQAWAEDQYPLRADFPRAGLDPKRTPADSDYPFNEILGSGVHEIPVGPVHAGIIEPGHFRFHAVGEEVLSLETRLGYVHKGIEKIAVGRDPEGLARLAGRVSGDSTVAHTWAACMAMERAVGINVPTRALAIRAILAERERIANHLGDIGAICNDVGFSFAHMQCARLRELWQRGNQQVFGHRLLMDRVVPGGVLVDLTQANSIVLRQQHKDLSNDLSTLLPILDDLPSLEDRLANTGVLAIEIARKLGVVGYLGKASGIDYDLRRDHGYAPYDSLSVESPCDNSGDVEARVQIRTREIGHSLLLLEQLLNTLPAGALLAKRPAPISAGQGIGLVEGWRGEIFCYVRVDDDGRIARFFPRDPSWFSWPALEQLIHGNIVPDFPVCNKSVNGTYSGHDL